MSATVVGPSPTVHSESGASATPAVAAADRGFESRDSPTDVALSASPQGDVSVSTATGELSLQPLNRQDPADNGEVAECGDAVIYANTGPNTDTAVRPTADGVETFEVVRDERSPNTFSWKIDLPGDETLQRTDDGGVKIVDPTPQLSAEAAGTQPSSTPATTADYEQLKQAGTLAADAGPPDPTVPATAQAAVDAAGAQPVSPEVVDGIRASRRDSPPVADVKGATRMAELLRRTARVAAPGAPNQLRVFYRDDNIVLSPRT
jgi:hypothetical protein